ncbi:MAG: N-glycosylase/DNA lyase [Candidatus Nanoarchaeia archaeon]
MNSFSLFDFYKIKKKQIKQKLKEFSRIKENDIFYELCFCILTPQSSAMKCWKAVEYLKRKSFLEKCFNPEACLRKAGVRFYKNKSCYLLEARKMFPLRLPRDSFAARELLVKNIKGLGYKEASHFLRNIGYKGLAILDRHILKNLKEFGIIKEIPKTLARKRYLEIESKFMTFSKKIKIPIDELDLLFWCKETGEVFK